jgi:hypothetical protein
MPLLCWRGNCASDSGGTAALAEEGRVTSENYREIAEKVWQDVRAVRASCHSARLPWMLLRTVFNPWTKPAKCCDLDGKCGHGATAMRTAIIL